MKHVILSFTFLLFVGLGQGISHAENFDWNDVLPGSYAVTVKGSLPNGVPFTKLAMYSFQANGTMRQDYWRFEGDTPAGISLSSLPLPPILTATSTAIVGKTDVKIGRSAQPDYRDTTDVGKEILGMAGFHNTAPLTAYGKWSRVGESIFIAWEWGDSETWRVTWKDTYLVKLELYEHSGVNGGFFLSMQSKGANGTVSFYRNYQARNAGWGFGGNGASFGFNNAGWSFNEAAAKNYVGKYSRYNVWTCDAPEDPIKSDSLPLASAFYVNSYLPTEESFNVARNVSYDYSPTFKNYPWAFSYLARPKRREGMLSRKVIYHTGHDYNNDRTLVDNYGHTYSGLVILDRRGNPRGFVFSDLSFGKDCGKGYIGIVSSLYYLDDASCAAHVGTQPGSMGSIGNLRLEDPLCK